MLKVKIVFVNGDEKFVILDADQYKDFRAFASTLYKAKLQVFSDLAFDIDKLLYIEQVE